MTPLRKRMTEDLQLRGMGERTQQMYVRAVRQLSEHYSKSPDKITEEELRDWTTLAFVRAKREKKLPAILSKEEVRKVLGNIRLLRYRVCLTTIYSCGLRLQEGTHLQVPDIDSARGLIHVHLGKEAKKPNKMFQKLLNICRLTHH